MPLPPELVDEIIFHLRHDKPTLLICSVVAKSWVYWSRKLLRDWHLRFTPDTLRTWKETASPEGMGLLQHVRSLTCARFHPLDNFHGDHLRSLNRLQHIVLCRVSSIRSDLTNSLPASQNTLSSLHLSLVFACDNAILNLIVHFPNLKNLHIERCTIWQGFRNFRSTSRSPRGKLRLTDLTNRDMSTLSAHLSKLELGYDEIEISSTLYGPSDLTLLPIIHACGKALARLEFSPSCTLSGFILKSCSGLRELAFAIYPTGSRSTELHLLESITSTNMRKITLMPHVGEDGWHPSHWSSLDMVFSNLVDRLRASGYKHTLELEFRLEPKSAGLYPIISLNTTLPRFRERGRVTVLDSTLSGGPLRSDR